MPPLGLLRAGHTDHFVIGYEDALGMGEARSLATALMADCERDLRLVQTWFPDRRLPSTPLTVLIRSEVGAVAEQEAVTDGIELQVANGEKLVRVRYLFVRELSKEFMRSELRGPTVRDGLALFLAAQALAANALGVPAARDQYANRWMNSERVDYVNGHGDDGQDDARSGCAVLFLYYLFAELKFNAPAIAAAFAPDLAGVYTRLTGKAGDPFPPFKALLDARFPGRSRIPGTHPDNPWPIGHLVDDAVGRVKPLPVIVAPRWNT